MDYPSPVNHYQARHIALIADSHRKLLGKPLADAADSARTLAETLFYAPFALLSHDAAHDPVFNYANLAALNLFEYTWAELTALPSRKSAEAGSQSERATLLAAVEKNGYADRYQGIRRTRSGRRFIIENACVWNLTDAENRFRGQAACFHNWRFL